MYTAIIFILYYFKNLLCIFMTGIDYNVSTNSKKIPLEKTALTMINV